MPHAHRKKLLVDLTLGAFAMLIFHFFWTQSFYYAFLPWNLLLGAIPFFIARLFAQCFESGRRAMASIWLLLWLFFFPNGPYIITDYIHVYNPLLYFELSGEEPYYDFETFTKPPIEMIYEFFLVSIVVVIALILSFESIAIILKSLKKKIHKLKTWHITLPLGVLTGIAVYIGRVMRFNSWDALLKPHIILMECWSQIQNGVLLQPIFLLCFFGSIVVVCLGYLIQQKYFREPSQMS